MTLSIDNTDHTAKGEDNRIQALTDAIEALQGDGGSTPGVTPAFLSGTNNTSAHADFGVEPGALPNTEPASRGTTPFVALAYVDDTIPSNENSSISGANIGSYDKRTSGDFAVQAALNLDVNVAGDGNVGLMSGLSSYTWKQGSGTVSLNMVGGDFGIANDAGIVSGNMQGIHIQAFSNDGTVVGYAAGIDVSSQAGVASGANYGILIQNQGTGANDFAIKTAGGRVCHDNTPVPTSASAAGTKGEIAWDSGFVYVCVATNTWKRAAIATW